MEAIGNGAHILVFPYPAQGHLLPLLDLTHKLSNHYGLSITILVTPKNLSFLKPLLSNNPSIQTLVLPFPAHPSIPAGVENSQDLPPNGFRLMMSALAHLYDPLLHWFQAHPSPPVSIISDMFLGWTQRLAHHLGIRRLVFSPSGAMALSFIDSLWRYQPELHDPNDQTALISFPDLPNSPSYPWCHLSTIYRSYVKGDPLSEEIKDGFYANMESWAVVINSFDELERPYINHLKKALGHDRVWAVGPVLPPGDDFTGPIRGGSSSVLASDIMTWLDTCRDHTVVYVCFGSQAVLSNEQMIELALGLEKSGAKFILCVKEPTKGHVEGKYGVIPSGFEDSVAGRGMVIRGWVPQVMILRHRAVGAFLTHCGWNSVLESTLAGVPMLAWPMGADQFVNATLLVDQLRVGIRVCEGAQGLPKAEELGKAVAQAVGENHVERNRAVELRKAALEAIKEGGSSFKDLKGLVRSLSNEVDNQ